MTLSEFEVGRVGYICRSG